jgi:hypothetical protein
LPGKGKKDKKEMTDRLSISTFTIEVDRRPTIVFKAKKYAEAEAICEDEELRAKLRLLKSGQVPICSDSATIVLRLAHPDEAALYSRPPPPHRRPTISCWFIWSNWMIRKTDSGR